VLHSVAALRKSIYHCHHLPRIAIQQLLVLVHGQPELVALLIVAGEMQLHVHARVLGRYAEMDDDISTSRLVDEPATALPPNSRCSRDRTSAATVRTLQTIMTVVVAARPLASSFPQSPPRSARRLKTLQKARNARGAMDTTGLRRPSGCKEREKSL